MFPKDLLPHIHAKSKTDRYSLNFLKWIKQNINIPLFVAIATEGKYEFDPSKTQASIIYIGYGNIDDGYLHGSRLSEILCNGVKADSCAYGPGYKFEIIPLWFQHYIDFGKCAIDPEHTLYSNNERWKVSEDEKSRVCAWCNNYTEHKHIKLVKTEKWLKNEILIKDK